MGRAALKVDYPNCPGGGKRGAPANRKSVHKNTQDDQESHSSGSRTNCFGFVAYSVNTAEKQRVKIQALAQETDGCSRAPSPCQPPSPARCPSPRRFLCVEQLDPQPPAQDRRERPCKRKRFEVQSSDMLDIGWLG